MKHAVILLLASLGGCAGDAFVPGGGMDDPANPAAPSTEPPAVSQTLAARDGPATAPAEPQKKTDGGHQHHAH